MCFSAANTANKKDYRKLQENFVAQYEEYDKDERPALFCVSGFDRAFKFRVVFPVGANGVHAFGNWFFAARDNRNSIAILQSCARYRAAEKTAAADEKNIHGLYCAGSTPGVQGAPPYDGLHFASRGCEIDGYTILLE